MHLHLFSYDPSVAIFNLRITSLFEVSKSCIRRNSLNKKGKLTPATTFRFALKYNASITDPISFEWLFSFNEYLSAK